MHMHKELSYTIEEVAQLLKVSKLTIYDLVKKGELPVFRVGRQMRMDAKDLEKYIADSKSPAYSAPEAKDASPLSSAGRTWCWIYLGSTSKKIPAIRHCGPIKEA